MLATALAGLLTLAASSASPASTAEARQPSTSFRDCSDCPRMIVLAGASFVIGSPADEPERGKNEGPQKAVTLPSFASSETEITRAQYAAFVAETQRPSVLGCDTQGDLGDFFWDRDPGASWRDPRFAQTDEHPVVCVSYMNGSDQNVARTVAAH